MFIRWNLNKIMHQWGYFHLTQTEWWNWRFIRWINLSCGIGVAFLPPCVSMHISNFISIFRRSSLRRRRTCHWARGRGSRWSEGWHSNTAVLRLSHPSWTEAKWQQRYATATLSTLQHNLHLCFQEDGGAQTHARLHTHAHTAGVRADRVCRI